MLKKSIRVSVILPTYNEAGNIIELVNQLQRFLEVNEIRGEIIIVDDSSLDRTGEMTRTYFADAPEVKVIIRQERGLATAIRTGIEAAGGNLVVVMDADFNHGPRLVPELVKNCSEYDMALGSRFMAGGGMADGIRAVLSKLYNCWLVNPLTGNGVSDNLSGFFAIKKEVLAKLDFDKIFYGYGDYFMRLIFWVRQNNYKITELPLYHQERRHGHTKSHLLKMLVEYSWSAGKLWRIRNEK